ncbi:MAG: 50S ribosomal protein L29 [Patescibacteria group bacterium]|nr:50S ribosomal protein L29 [Patescibacteria group bacterium]
MKYKEELKDLKLKSEAELGKLLAASREKLRDLRFKVSQNQLKNVREVRVITKKIALLLTLIGQKKLSNKASK